MKIEAIKYDPTKTRTIVIPANWNVIKDDGYSFVVQGRIPDYSYYEEQIVTLEFKLRNDIAGEPFTSLCKRTKSGRNKSDGKRFGIGGQISTERAITSLAEGGLYF